MANAHERHDISDESWGKMESLLPGRKGRWGGNARDNRQFINALFRIFRTGAPWRDLPPSYGDRKNTLRRFGRWRDRGIWEHLLEELIDNPEFELLWKAHFTIHALCRAMNVSRGTFYNFLYRAKPKTVYEKNDETLWPLIRGTFEDSKERFGANKIRIKGLSTNNW